jgi:hypothetical protein
MNHATLVSDPFWIVADPVTQKLDIICWIAQELLEVLLRCPITKVVFKKSPNYLIVITEALTVAVRWAMQIRMYSESVSWIMDIVTKQLFHDTMPIREFLTLRNDMMPRPSALT